MIEIDARGMRCPWPAIRLAKAIREHPGETIEIMADDPAAPRELGQLAANAGLILQDVEGSGNHRFRITP
ncbi:sulfurtransferase TusA family protein [Sphingomonas sp. G-3-2-10]|uniref:sulfurtransferase TusA family protein n=1 Tax=Sphingomonas sp. G-3-2-10 TaxID=2728838 RepID=UPI00321808D1